MVELSNRVSKWLAKAGVRNPRARTTIAVGITDSLIATTEMRRHLNSMLRTDPRTSPKAKRALRHAIFAGSWMFGELLDQLKEMKKVWTKHLENRLGSRAPK